MSETWPPTCPYGWWIMTFECGRQNRRPFVPPQSNTAAPEAAGVIHSDFQRGFIKAEIVAYEDLMAAGSVAAVRAAGKARLEGKDYVMRDGDVVEFRFNV